MIYAEKVLTQSAEMVFTVTGSEIARCKCVCDRLAAASPQRDRSDKHFRLPPVSGRRRAYRRGRPARHNSQKETAAEASRASRTCDGKMQKNVARKSGGHRSKVHSKYLLYFTTFARVIYAPLCRISAKLCMFLESRM